MHARPHHIVSQYSGILLVGGAGCDDIGPGDGLFGAGADTQVQTSVTQIPRGFLTGLSIDVVQMNRINAEHLLKGQSLKFALRSIADHSHCPRGFWRQIFCCHGAGGGRAQSCQDGHFCQ